ncbi:MAG: PepSY-associated TM helix domain-containing protein [Janthinobacterium lividum]
MSASDPALVAKGGETRAHSQNAKAAKRSVWLRQLHQWHWISSALCLLGMLLFAFTGITLNHSADIESRPKVSRRTATLPAPAMQELRQFALQHADADGKTDSKLALPPLATQWLAQNWSLKVAGVAAEWSPEEAYVALPRPGGDAWLRITLADGALEYELTDRGWISWLNDLHKGRNTGAAWSWFIDVFAAACLIFSLTGLLILKFHAANRPLTWPMVGMGILIPALLALLLIH